jgi:hypothetical protein
MQIIGIGLTFYITVINIYSFCLQFGFKLSNQYEQNISRYKVVFNVNELILLSCILYSYYIGIRDRLQFEYTTISILCLSFSRIIIILNYSLIPINPYASIELFDAATIIFIFTINNYCLNH